MICIVEGRYTYLAAPMPSTVVEFGPHGEESRTVRLLPLASLFVRKITSTQPLKSTFWSNARTAGAQSLLAVVSPFLDASVSPGIGISHLPGS